MSIQSSLNQIASLGAVGFTQSAAYKQKTEEKIAKQQEIRDESRKTAELTSAYEKAEKAGTAYQELQLKNQGIARQEGRPAEPIPESVKKDLYAKDIQASRELYQLDPTIENTFNYLEATRRYEALFKVEQKKQNKMEQSKVIQDNINRWGEINGKK